MYSCKKCDSKMCPILLSIRNMISVFWNIYWTTTPTTDNKMSIAYHYVHAIVNEKVMSQKLYDALVWQKRILIVHILFDAKIYY